MSDYLSAVFGESGLFASRFPGYEMRDGQVVLARMGDLAMREGRHALGEGPCGTGKGVAYGVPSVWHAHHRGKKVVIVTANIALQEQLIRKDMPLLAEVLPWPFTFALLKGRNNFLCHARMGESEARGELAGFIGDDLDRQLADVVVWAGETKTGDVSELSFVPSPRVWSRFSIGHDDCKGDGCRFRDACFVERAKAVAAEADIVVTNYHLLFAHLAVRRETDQDLVLPGFDFLVLDEAHEAVDIARDFFGFMVSEFTVIRLARFAEELGKKKLADQLLREASIFFSAVADHARSPAYKCRLKRPGFASAVQLLKPLDELAGIAAGIEEDQSLDREYRAEGRIVSRQSDTAAARIREAVALADPNKVYFINFDQKGRAKLCAKPVHVADLLRKELFGRTASVTMVSATMTTAGTFAFLRAEAGVPDDALEVVADSPFNFEHRALLVVPEGMPDPREPKFVEAAADAFKRVIAFCDGRTLGLFTSYRVLNAVYDQVRSNSYRVLRQGDLPRTELARIFKEDVHSVLFGTASFWTGIDVPGEALTGLVIDKLPFPHPEDPVVNAICERDPQAFNNYLVPRAILTLRQGVGRLIRSQRDIGVVVLLDRRVVEKSYGRGFLRSLPPMRMTRQIENIPRFLEEAAHARAS
ncbi:MAG: hypothetical protein A2Y61_00365 [Chloroflexi bacterium RBG_13_60_13]|nr:MAG: hypothetical protein A2Y61_00365 [Chloroflexi bacterium RBG_13_60_13]